MHLHPLIARVVRNAHRAALAVVVLAVTWPLVKVYEWWGSWADDGPWDID